MTILAIERNSLVNPYTGQPFDVVYIGADSRITRGDSVTTELAPKILPVHMAVGNKDGERRYFQPYGFGFAGSVVSASLTHSVAEHCLMALFGDHHSVQPTVEEVAEIYAFVADSQIREIGARLTMEDAQAALFEAVICGLSPETGTPRAFYIAPTLAPEMQITCSEIDLSGGVFRIGLGAKEFDAARADMSANGDSPTCIDVIGTMLEKQLHKSVGGYIQAATVDFSGFYQVELIHNVRGGDIYEARYLGIDLASIPRPKTSSSASGLLGLAF